MASASKPKGSRPLKARRGNASLLPTCGWCQVKCAENGANWYEGETGDDGVFEALGPLCYVCGTHADKREVTAADYVHMCDPTKGGSKRALASLKEEREQHMASQQKMEARSFPVFNVTKSSVHGVYTEDCTGFTHSDDYKEKFGVGLSDTKVAYVSRAFPNDAGAVGVLRNEDSTSVTRVERVPTETPGVNLIRFCKDEVKMERVLLDGAKEWFKHYKLNKDNNHSKTNHDDLHIHIQEIYVSANNFQIHDTGQTMSLHMLANRLINCLSIEHDM